MKKYYKSYGCTASITEKKDGTAKLVVKDPSGKKVKDSVHKNFKAAEAAWKRFCS